jgi:hypothetical protein
VAGDEKNTHDEAAREGKVGIWARTLMALVALGAAVGCRPATADPCAQPPPWRQVYPKPGQPDAELWGCLNDAAWDMRAANVPLDSKVAGLIAECQVDVDKFEGNRMFGSATDADEDRAAAEQRAQQLARAAVAEYQACRQR